MFKYYMIIKKNMTETRKKHFRVGEVKAKILEIVLENNGPITEPDIRTRLKDVFEAIDQSTINRHLKYLKEKGCIDRVSPIEKTRLNYWDVISFDQLKNIRSEFEDLKLNNYERAITIVLNDNGYKVTELIGFLKHIQLLLSHSFFKACIDMDMEILFSRVGRIFNYNNAGFVKLVETTVYKSYNAFIAQFPDIGISEKDFWVILNDVFYKETKSFSEEVFMRVWKDKLDEPNFNALKAKETTYDGILSAARGLWRLNDLYHNEVSYSIFESYYFQDVLLDEASDEENIFAFETKAGYDAYSQQQDQKDSLKKAIYNDLRQASVVMKNHKQPTLFDKKIYDNEDDIFKSLEMYFKKQIEGV